MPEKPLGRPLGRPRRPLAGEVVGRPPGGRKPDFQKNAGDCFPGFPQAWRALGPLGGLRAPILGPFGSPWAPPMGGHGLYFPGVELLESTSGANYACLGLSTDRADRGVEDHQPPLIPLLIRLTRDSTYPTSINRASRHPTAQRRANTINCGLQA